MATAHDSLLVLEPNTDVSAKYRGAWCEGTIKSVERIINCKVSVDGSSFTINSDELTGKIHVNGNVTLKHPKTKVTTKGVITKITDSSFYTVRFDDGDFRRLRRAAVTIKGPAHYEESETIGKFGMIPLPHTGLVEPRKRRHIASPGGDSKGRNSRRSSLLRSLACFPEAPSIDYVSHQVVLVDSGTEDGFCWPALIVPQKEVEAFMVLHTDYDDKHMVVRFFSNHKFAVIKPEQMRLLARGTRPYVLSLQIPQFQSSSAVADALNYIDTGDLPEGFAWPGFNEEVDNQAVDSGDENWSPNPVEEKSFQKAYKKFCESKGLKHKRPPSLGFRDLDLFRLFSLVAKEGGPDVVAEKDLWKDIHASMRFEPSSNAGSQMSNAYEKHLKGVEVFYIPKGPAEKAKKESPSKQPKRKPPSSPVGKPKRGRATASIASSEGNPAPESSALPVDPSEFEYEIGSHCRAESEGKFYNAMVEDRRVKKVRRKWETQYLIHYSGWSKRHDEWLTADSIKPARSRGRRGKPKRKVSVDSKSHKKVRTEDEKLSCSPTSSAAIKDGIEDAMDVEKENGSGPEQQQEGLENGNGDVPSNERSSDQESNNDERTSESKEVSKSEPVKQTLIQHLPASCYSWACARGLATLRCYSSACHRVSPLQQKVQDAIQETIKEEEQDKVEEKEKEAENGKEEKVMAKKSKGKYKSSKRSHKKATPKEDKRSMESLEMMIANDFVPDYLKPGSEFQQELEKLDFDEKMDRLRTMFMKHLRAHKHLVSLQKAESADA